MLYKIKKMIRGFIQKAGILAVLATALAGSGCSTTPQVSESYRISQDADRCFYHPAFQNKYTRREILFMNGHERQRILEDYQARPKTKRSSERAKKVDKDSSGTATIIQSVPVPGLENFPGRNVGSALYSIGEI